MKNLLKKILLPPLWFIRKTLRLIMYNAIPVKRPIAPKKPYDRFLEDELEDCYNHFKKYFHEAIFLDFVQLREFAIRKAIENHKSDYHYFEFGVYVGTSINLFSKILKDIKIYGFDSFEGLTEDWSGNIKKKGDFNLKKKIPKLNNNCVPLIGLVQDTLPKFISGNKDLKINFVHMDMDTYQTTKFVLSKIKPYLVNGAIILFDEMYNLTGWKVGEYKALTEVFNEKEYKFMAFAKKKYNVAIQYIKI